MQGKECWKYDIIKNIIYLQYEKRLDTDYGCLFGVIVFGM